MENEWRINYKKILKFLICAILTLAALFVSFKLIVFFLPFVIAFIISKIIERPVSFLNKKFKLPRMLAVIISIILFVGIISSVLYFFFAAVANEIISLSVHSDQIFPLISNNVSELLSRFTFFYQQLNLPTQVIDGINNSFIDIFNSLLKTLSSYINTAGNAIINAIISLPNILVYIIITMLSTFFISSDKKFISDSLEKHLPLKWIIKVQDIINDLFHALGGYLKAQGILITITFTELLIGFSIYKINYALILAIVIAIIDALPILGTGTVLIPWALISLVSGNYQMAVYLLLLYLFILVVRQLIEPKIVGQQIGIYPLLTLIAMYTGVQLIGILGLILGPILLIVLKNILNGIYKKGMIKELFDWREGSAGDIQK